MITTINIKNVTSYNSANGIEIRDLKKVNFFFGFNGSGKSTIANYLRNLSLSPDKQNADYNECTQSGFNSDQQEILTFNEEFTSENFVRNSDMKGVFSLNQSNAIIDQQIAEEELKIQTLVAQKETYQRRSRSLDSDEKAKDRTLTNHCWNQRSVFSSFSRISLVHSGSKPNHQRKIQGLLQNPLGEIRSLSALREDYQRLYENESFEVQLRINRQTYLEIRRLEVLIQSILQEVIVGKEDVEISALIASLASKSWVEEGLSFLDKTDGICPFCQSPTIDENLLSQFEEVFDESYKQKIASIEQLRELYIERSDIFINELVDLQNEFNPNNEVSNVLLSIRTLFSQNIETIRYKIKHSNEKKSITSLSDFKKSLSSIIAQIKENNRNHNSIDSNKEILKKNIWKFMANKCKTQIESNDLRKTKYSILKSLSEELLSRVETDLSTSRNSIESLRSQTVNTQEAVDNINAILKNSGYDGFEIDEKENTNNISRYYLKRPNSTNSVSVFNTLSEGEKNFISFLYFYQRCLGTDNLQGNGNKKKIIVIDDPVSSLDSQALFIVSTLIHNLILRKSNSPRAEKKEFKNPNIQQVFILTHNLYFYREVSFDKRPICTDFWHYKVSKTNNSTFISGGYNKTVFDDYSLMWSTLKEMKSNLPSDSSQNIMISNTMRRIIESYVNFIGYGRDAWSSLITIDNTDPTHYIKSAFISTINDESHGVGSMDTVYYQKIINEQPQVLFNVFSSIFQHIGKEHYEMSMDEELT